MVCPANSSYSFRATALIFCRMFIHIMEVCMSIFIKYLIMTGSWTWSFFYAPATKSRKGGGDFCQIFTKWQIIGLYFLLTNMVWMGNNTHFTTGNIFIFTYQEWKIKGTICVQVEYDRTSYIVLKNFWLVYNFLGSGRGIIFVLQTLHF